MSDESLFQEMIPRQEDTDISKMPKAPRLGPVADPPFYIHGLGEGRLAGPKSPDRGGLVTPG